MKSGIMNPIFVHERIKVKDLVEELDNIFYEGLNEGKEYEEEIHLIISRDIIDHFIKQENERRQNRYIESQKRWANIIGLFPELRKKETPKLEEPFTIKSFGNPMKICHAAGITYFEIDENSTNTIIKKEKTSQSVMKYYPLLKHPEYVLCHQNRIGIREDSVEKAVERLKNAAPELMQHFIGVLGIGDNGSVYISKEEFAKTLCGRENLV